MKGFKVNCSSVLIECTCGNTVLYKYLIPKDVEEMIKQLTLTEIKKRTYCDKLYCKACGNNINIPRLR